NLQVSGQLHGVSLQKFPPPGPVSRRGTGDPPAGRAWTRVRSCQGVRYISAIPPKADLLHRSSQKATSYYRDGSPEGEPTVVRPQRGRQRAGPSTLPLLDVQYRPRG